MSISNEKQLVGLMNCFSFFKHKNYTLAKNKCQNNCFHKKLLIYSQLELKLNNFSSLQEVITQNMSIFRQIKYLPKMSKSFSFTKVFVLLNFFRETIS